MVTRDNGGVAGKSSVVGIYGDGWKVQRGTDVFA